MADGLDASPAKLLVEAQPAALAIANQPAVLTAKTTALMLAVAGVLKSNPPPRYLIQDTATVVDMLEQLGLHEFADVAAVSDAIAMIFDRLTTDAVAVADQMEELGLQLHNDTLSVADAHAWIFDRRTDDVVTPSDQMTELGTFTQVDVANAVDAALLLGLMTPNDSVTVPDLVAMVASLLQGDSVGVLDAAAVSGMMFSQEDAVVVADFMAYVRLGVLEPYARPGEFYVGAVQFGRARMVPAPPPIENGQADGATTSDSVAGAFLFSVDDVVALADAQILAGLFSLADSAGATDGLTSLGTFLRAEIASAVDELVYATILDGDLDYDNVVSLMQFNEATNTWVDRKSPTWAVDTGAPTHGSSSPKFHPRYATFNGSSRIEATGISAIGSAQFAIQGWFRTTTSGLIFASNALTGSSNPGVFFCEVDSASAVISITTPSFSQSAVFFAPGGTTFTDGQWHYYSGIRSSATGQLHLSVDGGAQANSGAAGYSVDMGNPMYGGDPGGIEFFTGDLSDWRITVGQTRPHTVPTAAFPDYKQMHAASRNDTVAVSDAVAYMLALSADDTAAAADAMEYVGALLLNETPGAADALTSIGTFTRPESVTAIDAMVAAFLREHADSASAADAMVSLGTFTRAETAEAADVLVSLGIQNTIADGATVGDNVDVEEVGGESDPADVFQSIIGGISSANSGFTPVLPGASQTGSTFVISITEAGGQAGTQAPTDEIGGVATGNVYVQAGTTQANSNNAMQTRVYYCVNGTGGANHRAALAYGGGNTGDPSIIFLEIRDARTTSVLDSASLAQGQDDSEPWGGASGTFLDDNELVLAFSGNGGGAQTYSIASGNAFTMVNQQGNGNLYWTHCVAKLQHTATTAVTPAIESTDGTQATWLVMGFRSAA